ncbi:FecCD family ABC transporter permease [Micromonospora craniellae]|uniref:Iron ABC transporter permease n=1 Tax=Micromonospora craniellae TaxID=2294034 RepID=A0A372FXV9_9ACTN|nr:iron chelate uptake ABC transporter family permease subunit [Micromonospora craniellae]RFS45625.1 iron ABC transporter permease [Micromonospora craniellae]
MTATTSRDVPGLTDTAEPRGRSGRTRRRLRPPFWLLLVLLTAGLLVTLTTAVTIGPVGIPFLQVWQIVADRIQPGLGGEVTWTPIREQIVWDLRMPRVLLGAVVGAGLAVVGATLQALVRNPLADPYVFGITSGASTGATALLALGIAAFGSASLSVAAFGGAVLAFVLVLVLAGAAGGLAPARLILAGLTVAYTMSALTSLMIFLASTAGQSSIAETVLFWLLGGLGGARWSHVLIPGLVAVVGTALVTMQARSLNALLVGEETAATLGVNLGRFRLQMFTLTALMTGVMVAVSGGIGFVGLMVPHAVRLLVGSDNRRVLPVSMLLGAIFLVWADVVARIVVAPQELPIGIITALVGAPFFVAIMRSKRRLNVVGER